jgi:hypothetical protein
MRRRIGVRRTFTFPPELIKAVEDEAEKRLQQNSGRIGKIQYGSVCRTIICIAIKRQLFEIAKMTKEEFNRYAEQLGVS